MLTFNEARPSHMEKAAGDIRVKRREHLLRALTRHTPIMLHARATRRAAAGL
jgi:hypothetical protein